MTIRDVAILMLILVLTMPAIVHAYTLQTLGSEATHAVGNGCHGADRDTDHDPTGNHRLDVRCCGLDAPYILPSSCNPLIPVETGRQICPSCGRQLDGYAGRIDKPPRSACQLSTGNMPN
jgi:hypothetical protein